MAELSRLMVVVLHWKWVKDTLECLASLTTSSFPLAKVILVDNASQDAIKEQVQAGFPEVTILQNQQNCGYAGGNNTGINLALQENADLVLIVNNDVVLAADTIEQMVRGMEDKTIAAVGCKVRIYEDPQRLWAAGNVFARGRYPRDDGSYDQPKDINYAVGCCILLRASVLREVGLFDPLFFLVHEEREWCYRAWAAGYRCRYAPLAVVRHKMGGAFTNQFSPAYHYYYVRNELLLRSRYESSFREKSKALRALQTLYREVRFILHIGRHKARRLGGALWGARDFLGDRFGENPHKM